MRVLKKLALLLLVFSFVLPLASCHGELKEKTDNTAMGEAVDYLVPETFDTSKEYELTFWAKSDSNATQTAIYQKAITDFEKLYPNIKINLKIESDYGRIYSDVITNIPTGTTPNICITYPDHVATYLTGDCVVVPLDKLMADEKFGLGGSELRFDGPDSGEIINKFLDECKVGGMQYALPYMRSTEACYVNKTYVEALGYELPETLTWDFIWEVSEAALAKNADGTYKVNGQNVMIPFIYKSTDNMMIQMLAQKDAPYSTSDGEINVFNETAKELLLEISKHAETRAFSTFKISSYPGNYINRGQCIFAIDSTAGATWMGTDAPNIDIPEEELVDFEAVVMEIPQFNEENPKMISQGPSVCIFNKEDPGEVLASWLFMQFLLTDDVQIPYSQTEGYVPVTTKAQSNPDYVDYISRSGEDNELHYSLKIDAAKLLIRNTENTFVTPVFNGSASLRNAAGQMIEEITKSARRNEKVTDSYVENLYREMASRYKLDTELGDVPAALIVIFVSIALIDLSIISYFIYTKIKKRKNASH